MVPSIFLDRCTIHGNRAPDDIATPTGGGVLAAAGAVTVQSTIVCSNAGGGLVCLPDAVQASILSDYCDVWNNGPHDYFSCLPGLHSISSDPLHCGGSGGSDPPWYCLYDTSPCNGTGRNGDDMGAGWVACYSVGGVVFYDNFSDQSDDGWVAEEPEPGQVEVEAGEYSMDSRDSGASAHVADLSIDNLEYTVWFRPLETQMGGENRFYFRGMPGQERVYELSLRTEEQRGTLVRWEDEIGCIMADFECPIVPDAWHRLTVTAAGAQLAGVLEIPFGLIVPLFDLTDPAPLPGGTVGLAVAWRAAPGGRGAQHTYFDRIMVRAVTDPASVRAGDRPDAGDSQAPEIRVFPNPSRGDVRFTLPSTLSGTIELFDLQGRLVRTLRRVDPAEDSAPLRLSWDGRDEAGRPVASGWYAWRLEGERGARAVAHGRLILLR
jgi:hypothetical protein